MPTKYFLKRGLPPNLPDLFERGRFAHVILVSHRRNSSGEPEENVVICMSRRHEYIDPDGRDDDANGEDPNFWESLEGDDIYEALEQAGKGRAIPDADAEQFKDLRAAVSTTYRKCKTTGDLCYLLVTETRRTCVRLGGSATGLSLCSS